MRYSAFQFSYIVFSKLCLWLPTLDSSPPPPPAWVVYFFMMASLMCFGLIFYILFKNGQNFGVHVWAWFMWVQYPLKLCVGLTVYNLPGYCTWHNGPFLIPPFSPLSRVPLMWGAVMHLVQGFLCHVVFLKDKTVSKTGFVPLRFK